MKTLKLITLTSLLALAVVANSFATTFELDVIKGSQLLMSGGNNHTISGTISNLQRVATKALVATNTVDTQTATVSNLVVQLITIKTNATTGAQGLVASFTPIVLSGEVSGGGFQILGLINLNGDAQTMALTNFYNVFVLESTNGLKIIGGQTLNRILKTDSAGLLTGIAASGSQLFRADGASIAIGANLTFDGTTLDGVPTGGAAIPNAIGNFVPVSKSGNDSQGKRNSWTNTFQTINAAKAVAQARDLIVVLPGKYSETGTILTNDVDYWFWGNVTVTNTDYVFNDRQTGATSNTIYGSLSVEGTNGLAKITNSSTRLEITFKDSFSAGCVLGKGKLILNQMRTGRILMTNAIPFLITSDTGTPVLDECKIDMTTATTNCVYLGSTGNAQFRGCLMVSPSQSYQTVNGASGATCDYFYSYSSNTNNPNVTTRIYGNAVDSNLSIP